MTEFERAGYEPETAEQAQALANKNGIEPEKILHALDDPYLNMFAMGIGGNVKAGICPPWPYRAERRCRIIHKGQWVYYTNPPAGLCAHCWQRALKRPDMVEKIRAGKHAKKDERFR